MASFPQNMLFGPQSRNASLVAACLAPIVFCAGSLLADDVRWVGPFLGPWTSTSSWINVTRLDDQGNPSPWIPTMGDDATIIDSSPLINGDVAVAGNLWTEGGLSGLSMWNGSLAVQGTLTMGVYSLIDHIAGTVSANQLDLVSDCQYQLDSVDSMLQANYEHLGISSTGGKVTFVHDGGRNIAGGLMLAFAPGSYAVYSLSGGALSTAWTTVGEQGLGQLQQIADHYSGRLVVGYAPSSSGIYLLNGGQLVVSQDGNVGLFDEIIGWDGHGTFIQSSGIHSARRLFFGIGQGEGTYTLNNGTLNVTLTDPGFYAEGVGAHSFGSFTQNGGTHNVMVPGWGLLIAWSSPASRGEYYLNSGTLHASEENVGFDGTGTFDQAGGANTLTAMGYTSAQLFVGRNSGSHGTYNLHGGTISANGLILGAMGNGSFNQSGGILTGLDYVTIGDQSGGVGAYTLTGGSVSAAYWGIGQSGVGSMFQSGGSVVATDHISIGDHATGIGSYALSGTGAVHANHEVVGWHGHGSFIQSGGTHAIDADLYVGGESDAVGVMRMTGPGTLTSGGTEYIGYSGSGSVEHSDGSNAAGVNLNIGMNTGAMGAYALSGTGVLSAKTAYVGYDGVGTFTQSGGTNTLQTLDIALHAAAQASSYSLSNGTLVASNAEIIGFQGTGSFAQNGGTNTIMGTSSVGSFIVGSQSGSNGSYTLANGLLEVTRSNEVIGLTGHGSFVQNGGVNRVSGIMQVAYTSTSTGSYLLNAGELDTGAIAIRKNGSLTNTAGTIWLRGTTQPVSATGGTFIQKPDGSLGVIVTGAGITQFGRLSVGSAGLGLASLDGTLRVRLASGYNPVGGEHYDIITGGVAGTFKSYDFEQFESGTKRFVVEYLSTAVRVWARGCPADFDGSGFVDLDDFTAFVHAFEAGTDDADFDGSGFVDTDDFTAFVLAFEVGC